MGRAITQRDPKNHYTRYSYNLRGQFHRQWGDGAMPVEYGYDATYGDCTTMKTYRGGSGWDTVSGDGSNTANPWPASPGTADTTTWAYDGPTGLLVSKTDALGRTASQTYNARGQTATRALARGVVTTYGYDSATGELLTQTYSDSTPAVSFTYGRTGQVETVADVTGTRDLVYDATKPWRMTAEAHSAFYGSRVLTRLHDETGSIGRVRGFKLGATTGSNSDLEQTFGFTTVGRFETIASNRNSNSAGTRTFRYGYLTSSALLQSLSIDGNAFMVSRGYESQRDLVTSIDSKWSSTVRTGYAYTYDERGQRSKLVQLGDAFADYGGTEGGKTARQFAYNGRGELTADIGYLGSDISLADQQMPGRRHEYGYDPAGNRMWSNRTGNAALRDDYTTNALNQYVSRENNTLPVSGTAAAGPNAPTALAAGETAVSVQGGSLGPVRAGRKGGYWHDELAVPNVDNTINPPTSKPWRGPLTIFTAKKTAGGDLIRMDSRMAEIAAVLQAFTYDLDGNLTSDGIFDYAWDAENRLVRIETTVMARSYNFPHKLMEFKYDYMGRRVQKRVVDASQSLEVSSRRFLWDGWNLIAEYTAPGGTTIGALVRSYTWGLDIVNSMTSAGGVGALLQIADHPSGKTYLPTYDGNGNIVTLLNAVTGAAAAVYEYSPFGEPVRAQVFDPTMADNPFRFSTKYTDPETGLVYYGHRYYDPKNGRFINRDPIEESGGLNLYGFCGNNSVNRWDVLGMYSIDPILNDEGVEVYELWTGMHQFDRDYESWGYFDSYEAADSAAGLLGLGGMSVSMDFEGAAAQQQAVTDMLSVLRGHDTMNVIDGRAIVSGPGASAGTTAVEIVQTSSGEVRVAPIGNVEIGTAVVVNGSTPTSEGMTAINAPTTTGASTTDAQGGSNSGAGTAVEVAPTPTAVAATVGSVTTAGPDNVDPNSAGSTTATHTVTVQSYIAATSVSLGPVTFLGDNRGPSSSPSTLNRTSSTITVDPTNASSSGTVTSSTGHTIAILPGPIALTGHSSSSGLTGSSTYISPGIVRVNLSGSATNPLVPGAPPIAYNTSISINFNNGTYAGSVTRTDFPSFQIFVDRRPIYNSTEVGTPSNLRDTTITPIKGKLPGNP